MSSNYEQYCHNFGWGSAVSYCNDGIYSSNVRYTSRYNCESNYTKSGSVCDSGVGQFSQMLPQVVMVCSEFHTLMMGMYGFVILGIVLIIVGAVVSGKKNDVQEREVEDDALDILEKRYAKGEITKEEFDKMKRDLE